MGRGGLGHFTGALRPRTVLSMRAVLARATAVLSGVRVFAAVSGWSDCVLVRGLSWEGSL